MVPAIVLAIPVLLGVRLVREATGLDVRDTVFVLVVVNLAFALPLVIWLLKSVFEAVPRALEAAARIDGCSRLGTLFRITVPAAGPGIAATAILLLISTWNDWLFAVTLGARRAVTVTTQITNFDSPQGASGPPPFTLIAVAGIVAILPCLVLVLFFQRRLVRGLTEGIMKG
jgi:multiple sugar transport system permease protein